MLPLGPEHLERLEPTRSSASARPPAAESNGSSPDRGRGSTRRQLLVRGVVATGALIVSGVVVRFAALLGQDPQRGYRALTETEVPILERLIEALLPPGGEMPAADPAFLVPRLDRFLAQTDPDARLLFRAMLHAIEDQSRLFNLRRFSKLSLAERTAEISAWERTRIYTKRMAFSSVKLFIGMHYFDQPGVHESIGWYLGCSPSDRAVEGEGLG
jgi:gluconate 2-dehydrogenase subunit 3-like protein